MKDITLKQFREILASLAARVDSQEVQFLHDQDEDAWSAEIDEELVVSIYRREPDGPAVVGALLRHDAELESSLEAEDGGPDWELLDGLFSKVADSDSTPPTEDLLPEPEQNPDPHRFDPMAFGPNPAKDKLSDGDKPLAD